MKHAQASVPQADRSQPSVASVATKNNYEIGKCIRRVYDDFYPNQDRTQHAIRKDASCKVNVSRGSTGSGHWPS